ncbi:TD and POZ domain-containing protein 1 [Caerostris extrusa]|uniref:TD and POZ domain-containing protein 1 n=1 Tax=Caerostris extrusa TaxID=172846 RepID=A0AAV4XRC0_CAEEX|nr:TD and POZ domain-containing protein 1 [Caerostris extrusa]
MWKKHGGSNLDGDQCFARTRIELERICFSGVIDKFSTLIPMWKRAIHLKSTSVQKEIMRIAYVTLRKYCNQVPVDFENVKLSICKILILDSSNKWEEFGICQDFKKPGEVFSFVLLKAQTSSASEERKGLPRTFKDEITSLYKEGILCDTHLRIETESFPAHKAVLSARSAVFKSMFSTDMREKTQEYVDIPNLSSDTVRRMLWLMYSDEVEDLDWERAKCLYFAADKYEILSLKQKCADFLKDNVDISNCCDILLLADTHQDKDLKKKPQDFTVDQSQEVFVLDVWKSFMVDHSQLAAEVTCLKCVNQ